MKNIEALVRGVYIVSPEGESIASHPVAEAQVTLEGFAGDRHAGWDMHSNTRTKFYPRGTLIRNSRQVSIVSLEELEEVAALMGLQRLLPEWLGANLVFSGVPNLSRLPPGTRLFFPGEATLLVQAENGPCLTAGAEIQTHFPERAELASQFPRLGLHKRGIVAVVERPGVIHAGEAVRVAVPDQIIYE